MFQNKINLRYCASGRFYYRNEDINTGWHKKTGTFENPTKIEEIQEKKFIDRN